ncbi:MAG: hypothetical protein M1836_004976 [Candelina mexicana]|nr:MAG: hypothetical protein M1836_004976 [Candelina mexicana]
MGKRKELSHEELWDDSALIRSWDEALQEYNLYHSIHARGERVEDILREVENQQSDADRALAKDSYNASTNNHGDHEHMNGDSAPQNGKSGAENSQVPEDERVQETPQQSAVVFAVDYTWAAQN